MHTNLPSKRSSRLLVPNDTVEKNGQKIKYRFYLYPKKYSDGVTDQIGVIGGTFIVGATEATPNNEEFEEVLKHAKNFFGLTSSDQSDNYFCQATDKKDTNS